MSAGLAFDVVATRDIEKYVLEGLVCSTNPLILLLTFCFLPITKTEAKRS